LSQEYEAALGDYNTSIELEPHFLFAKIQRAVCLYRLGKHTESEQAFMQIKADAPNVADTYYYHGEIMLDQNKIDDAVREFDRAIKANPKMPLPYLNKARFITIN
jgi:tetratricopeptide (TPR) repeat protein